MALYSDFHIAFEADPFSRDLQKVEDEDAVVQAIKLLILTSLYERPFQPSLGSTVMRTLFEPMDAVTKLVLARTIKDVIDQFEPRAELKYVDIYDSVGPHGETLDASAIVVVVGFYVYNRPTLTTATVTLRRLR